MSHTTKLNNVVWRGTHDYDGDSDPCPVAVTYEDGRYKPWFRSVYYGGGWKTPGDDFANAILSRYIDHLRAGEPAMSESVYWARMDLDVAIQECVRLGVSSAPPQKKARDRAHAALDTLIEFLSESEAARPAAKEKL